MSEITLKVRCYGYHAEIPSEISDVDLIESIIQMEEKAAPNRLIERLPDAKVLEVKSNHLANFPMEIIATSVKFVSAALDFAETELREIIEREIREESAK